MKRAVLNFWAWLSAWLAGFLRKKAPQPPRDAYRVIALPEVWRVHTPIGWIKIPRDGRWKFDGNLENPSFWPSVVEEWENADGTHYCNHVFIRAGVVQFLRDCSHELAGKSVELLPLTSTEMAFHYKRDSQST